MARDRRDEDEGGFLGRWSRRKAEARRAETSPDRAPPAGEAGEGSTEPVEAAGRDPESVRVEDLPEVDSLTEASDFKVFMQKGVPAELRMRALRRLWQLKPSLANLDGLVDYGGDFTRSGVGVAGIRTAYQVGRGFLDQARRPKEDPPPENVTGPVERTAPAAEQAGAEAGGRTDGDLPAPDDPPADPDRPIPRRRPLPRRS